MFYFFVVSNMLENTVLFNTVSAKNANGLRVVTLLTINQFLARALGTLGSEVTIPSFLPYQILCAGAGLGSPLLPKCHACR